MASENESEKRETLVDIVEEMRNGTIPKHRTDHELLALYADRIEAAAKREELRWAKENGELARMIDFEKVQVGDAAAIREALIIAKKAICHHAKHICQSLSWENSDIQSNCADVLCAHRELCKAKTEINSALSLPQRNCDRFNSGEPKKDATDAYDEWQRYCDCSLMPQSCKVESAFRQWIFAKSETQGECDGM